MPEWDDSDKGKDCCAGVASRMRGEKWLGGGEDRRAGARKTLRPKPPPMNRDPECGILSINDQPVRASSSISMMGTGKLRDYGDRQTARCEMMGTGKL